MIKLITKLTIAVCAVYGSLLILLATLVLPLPPAFAPHHGAEMSLLGYDYSSLRPMVQDFYNLAGEDTKRMRVVFGPLPAGVNGAAFYLGDISNGGYLVVLNYIRWEQMSGIERRALVYHELGHAALGRDHYNTFLPDNCPASLMNSYAISEWCLIEHWELYKFELIHNRKL